MGKDRNLKPKFNMWGLQSFLPQKSKAKKKEIDD